MNTVRSSGKACFIQAAGQTVCACLCRMFLSLLIIVNTLQAMDGPGLFVSELQDVPPESEIQPGDRLVSWEGLGEASGKSENSGFFNSLDDWIRFTNELLPRGVAKLNIKRADLVFPIQVLPSFTKLDIRPTVPTVLHADYMHVVSASRTNNLDNAARGLVDLARRAGKAGFVDLAWWCQFRAAAFFSQNAQTDKAEALLTELLAQTLSPTLQAETLTSRGLLYHRNNSAAAAAADFQQAVTILATSPEMVLQMAKVKLLWGVSFYNLGQLNEAKRLFLEIVETVEPAAPLSDLLARAYNNLGMVNDDQGVYGEAEEYYLKAYSLLTAQGKNDLDTAMVLNNLGVLKRQQGNFSEAESYYHKAMSVKRKLAPDSLDVAYTLTNLGVLAEKRGDFDSASRYHRQALQMKQKHAPGSLTVASALINLGVVSADPEEAMEFLQKARELLEKLAPRSLLMAQCLNNIAVREQQSGRIEDARRDYRRSFELLTELAPGTLLHAQALYNAGEMAMTAGDYDKAEQYLTHALDIRSALAPGSDQEAQSFNQLAKLFRQTSMIKKADEMFSRSVDSLEQQVGMVGGTDLVRSRFRGDTMNVYQDYIALLIDEAREAEAYHLLERSRARLFLRILEQRDLDFSDHLSPTLEQKRRQLRDDYQRLSNQLSSLSVEGDFDKRTALTTNLNTLAQERRQFMEKLRREVPQFSSMAYPAPLELEAALEALTEGTLLLEYSVGVSQTCLFALGPAQTDFAVHVIQAGLDELEQRVRLLRVSITQKEDVTSLSRNLGQLLLGPVKAEIERADRVLISPERPLSSLPFCVLVPGTTDARMLVELKPVHYTVSMTVYNELNNRNKHDLPFQIVAVGSPDYAPLRAMFEHSDTENIPAGFSFMTGKAYVPDLPHSKDEIEVVQGLSPDSSILLTDAAASERNLRAAMQRATLLHVAVHAFYDQYSPLESALILTSPDHVTTGEDNGFLQAWEIMEENKMPCDLVVLSGCNTAMGMDIGGEGVIGLTRAFQYAGVPSVIAATWFISDAATVHFMDAFYNHLAASQPLDVAVQQAQRSMISSRWSHPFYWAGFQLIGSDQPLGLPSELHTAPTNHRKMVIIAGLIFLLCITVVVCLFNCGASRSRLRI